MLRHIIRIVLFATLLAIGLGGCATGRPARPGPNFVWVPAHSSPEGVVVPGHWKATGPTPRGKVWVPAHRGPRGRWIPGHFR